MCHNGDMSHMERFTVQLGERGRLVLPAPLRRALGLHDGDQLVLDVDGDTIRLAKAREIAAAGRGMFADKAGPSMVDELLGERRAEARRESDALAAR